MTRARMLLRNAPWPNTELLCLLPRFTCLVFIAFVSSCDICNFMSQRRISKHNSYCEIFCLYTKQIAFRHLLPLGKQRSRTNCIHIAIAPPLAGRSSPTQPSEASGAPIRCLKRLQPVSWCKVQHHGPGRTTGLLPLCNHPPLHQPPKMVGLAMAGKAVSRQPEHGNKSRWT